MKMSSNEPSLLSPRQPVLQDTPSFSQLGPRPRLSSTGKPFSQEVPLAQSLALDLALAPPPSLGSSIQHQRKSKTWRGQSPTQ